jgi:hypothetical protein
MKFLLAENATARIAQNPTNGSKNRLLCSFRASNQNVDSDVNCRMAPSGKPERIQFTSDHARYSIAPLQIRNIHATGSLTAGKLTPIPGNLFPWKSVERGPGLGKFEFEMNVHNPNSSFVVPGAVSSDFQRRLHLSDASCKARFNLNRNLAYRLNTLGPDFFGMEPSTVFILDSNCQNDVLFTIGYSRYEQTDGRTTISASLSSKSHMGLAGLAFQWTFELVYPGTTSSGNRNLGRCDGDICTWNDFEASVSQIYYIDQ